MRDYKLQTKIWLKDIFKGLRISLGIIFGLALTGLLAVTVTGTVHTFSSGALVKASEINTNFASLKTAIEGIVSSQWTTNGANIGYTAGSVGIGTTSPAYKLDVKGPIVATDSNTTGTGVVTVSSDTAGISLLPHGSAYGSTMYGVSRNNMALMEGQGSSAFVVGTSNSSPIIFGVNRTENMRITSSGNVGIGTTTPLRPIHLFASSSPELVMENGTVSSGTNGRVWRLKIADDRNFHLVADPANLSAGFAVMSWSLSTNMITTDDAFKFGIGVGPTEKLAVNGCISHSGGTIGSGCVSDKSMKKNIRDIKFENSLEKIKHLRPVEYQFINDKSLDNKYGLIAQDVEKVIPEFVKTNLDGKKTLNYEGIKWLIVIAVQDLIKENLSQKEKFNTFRDLFLSEKLASDNRVLALEKENTHIKAEGEQTFVRLRELQSENTKLALRLRSATEELTTLRQSVEERLRAIEKTTMAEVIRNGK